MTSAAELPLPPGITVQRALRLSKRSGSSVSADDQRSTGGGQAHSNALPGSLERSSSHCQANAATRGQRAARRATRAMSLPSKVAVKQHLYDADSMPVQLAPDMPRAGQAEGLTAALEDLQDAMAVCALDCGDASAAGARAPASNQSAGIDCFQPDGRARHASCASRASSRNISRCSSVHAPLAVPVQTLSMPEAVLEPQPPLPPIAPAAAAALPARPASRAARRHRSASPTAVAPGLALDVSRPASRAGSPCVRQDPLHACMQDAIDRALIEVERSAASSPAPASSAPHTQPLHCAGTDSDGSNTSLRPLTSHAETHQISQRLLQVRSAWKPLASRLKY